MRASWICLAALVAGCQSVIVAGPSPQAPMNGGGGGGGPITPIAVCPVTFAGDLERAIAEVPDRRDQDALYVQWRLLDKRVNASSAAGVSASVSEFRALVDRLEIHGDLAPAHADRLRALAGCYASGS
jgi:hypothetical protein